MIHFDKVQLFWEGPKFCINVLMVLTFTIVNVKPWGQLCKLFWPSQKSWTLIRLSWFCILEFETPWPNWQYCTYLYILYIFLYLTRSICIFSQEKIPLIHLKKKFHRLSWNSVHTSTLNSNSNLFFKAQYFIYLNSRKYIESTFYVMIYVLYDARVNVSYNFYVFPNFR